MGQHDNLRAGSCLDLRRVRRCGQTLLELVGATTIMAIALVPALRITGDCMRIGGEIDTANLLATLSASKLEEHLVRTAAAWTANEETGSFTDYPNLRYRVQKFDEGIGSGLMRITSVVWEDANGNASWDTGEAQVTFTTKLARNVAYEWESSGD